MGAVSPPARERVADDETVWIDLRSADGRKRRVHLSQDIVDALLRAKAVSVLVPHPELVAAELRRHMSPADLARLAELLGGGG